MRRHSLAMLVTAAVMSTAAAQAQDTQPSGDAANGERIYLADGCDLCHGTVGQGGRGTGPHLAPSPMPYEAFAGQVRHPANAMPPYTTIVLSDRDLADIFAYLLTIPPLVDPKSAAILDN
jgi:ubiquinol-cytochrome c reductase cytochrome c subunit